MVIRRTWSLLAAPVAVAGLAIIGMRSAMLPGLGFWDTAELQVVAPVLGTAHPTGFPTYVVAGWLMNLVLAPFGEPALRMNLFAGLCVAVAAALTVDLVRTLTRSTALGVAAGLGLAFTPIVWAIGTRAETHALHLALLVLLVRLLVGWEDAHGVRRQRSGDADTAPGDSEVRSPDRWLVAAAVTFGLAMGNHSLILLLAVPISLFVVAVEPGILRRPRFVLTCLAVLVLTVVILFLELPLRAGPFRAPLVYGRPDTWEGFWAIVLAEQFRGSLIDPLGNLGPKALDLVARTMAAFGPLALLIPGGFVATALSRPRYALLSGTAVLITCFFAASYANADIGRYYLGPVLFAWTWLAILVAVTVRAFVHDPGTAAAGEVPGPGAGGVRGSSTGQRWPATRIATIALAGLLLVPTALGLPDRHDEVDRGADVSARRWVDGAMDLMEPGAVVLSWWSYSTPLWYAQHVDGQRPDIAIIDDRTRLDEGLGDIYDVIDANLPDRPVYVIREDPREVAGLAARYVLEPILGPDARFLTRVVRARETGT